MKAYIVKKTGQIPRAFVEEFYIGLVDNPTEHIRMEAMEYLYEGIPREEWSKRKITTKALKNVTTLEILHE